jgi:hypothetical protein
MSVGFAVDILATVGLPPVLLLAPFAAEKLPSNGLLVFAPDIPNTMTTPGLEEERLLLYVTVIA